MGIPPLKKIVVGIDVSGRERLVEAGDLRQESRTALAQGAWLARRSGASLHLLATIEVTDHAADMVKRRTLGAPGESVIDVARGKLDLLAKPLLAEGLRVTTDVVFGRAARAILEDVREHGRDLVVVGTRARGRFFRNVFGSTSLALLRKCPVAVWVARSVCDEAGRAVLAPVDAGDLAPGVLEFAGGLAGETGGTLHVMHVIDYSGEQVLRMGNASGDVIEEYVRERRSRAEAGVARHVAEHVPDGVDVETILADGAPAVEIVAMAGELGADLVVMGSVARSGLGSLVFGSTVENVLSALETSLVVIKPLADDGKA